MIALLLAVGCGGDLDRATWLEGFGFGWTNFNHRVSRLVAETESDEGRLAFVGGASTTGVDPELPAECTDGCEELPFVDTSDAELRYGSVRTRAAAFQRGEIELVVGAEGGSRELEVRFDRSVGGTGFAVLTGVQLTTDEALQGPPGCYDPGLGWHPRRIAVELGPPALEGALARVSVSAWFEAGNSLEDIRACIDLVNERASARFTVGVLVVVTDEPVTAQTFAGGMSFPWTGAAEPQVPTDEAPLDPAFGPNAMVGWSAFDWQFLSDDPDARGTYLRTVDLSLDLASGSAHGQATNYSPLTQIFGLDYVFSGSLVGATLPGKTLHGRAGVAGMAAALEPDGLPVVTRVELLDATL